MEQTLDINTVRAVEAACLAARPRPQHGDLLARLEVAAPGYTFRHRLTRNGWFRLGGLITPTGEPISDDIMGWAEAAWSMADEDGARLMAACRGDPEETDLRVEIGLRAKGEELRVVGRLRQQPLLPRERGRLVLDQLTPVVAAELAAVAPVAAWCQRPGDHFTRKVGECGRGALAAAWRVSEPVPGALGWGTSIPALGWDGSASATRYALWCLRTSVIFVHAKDGLCICHKRSISFGIFGTRSGVLATRHQRQV